jgi:hypothetical protein
MPDNSLTKAHSVWREIANAPTSHELLWLHCPELVSSPNNPEGVVEGRRGSSDGNEYWVAAVFDPVSEAWATERVIPTHWMSRPGIPCIDAPAASEPPPQLATEDRLLQKIAQMRRILCGGGTFEDKALWDLSPLASDDEIKERLDLRGLPISPERLAEMIAFHHAQEPSAWGEFNTQWSYDDLRAPFERWMHWEYVNPDLDFSHQDYDAYGTRLLFLGFNMGAHFMEFEATLSPQTCARCLAAKDPECPQCRGYIMFPHPDSLRPKDAFQFITFMPAR